MTHPVRLEHVSSIPLAVIRRQVKSADLSRVVPEGCGIVWDAVRAQNARGGRHVAVYLDGSIRLEVGVEVDGSFSEQGEVVKSATPSGVVATVTHFGPYHTLGGAHAAIRNWCLANHKRLTGPSWEIYGHWLDEWNGDPSRIRTDVFYQLEA
jgi:effector-binding domain-containing protein